MGRSIELLGVMVMDYTELRPYAVWTERTEKKYPCCELARHN